MAKPGYEAWWNRRSADGYGGATQLVSSVSQTAPSTSFLFAVLATSSGGTNMATSGSTAVPLVYYYQCPASRYAIVQRLNIGIQDVAIDPDKFGGSTLVTKGLKVQAYDTNNSSMLIDFTDGLNIKKNWQWGLLAGVDNQTDNADKSNKPSAFNVRWTIGKAGAPLNLTSGQQIRMTVQDDISDLDEMYVMIQGVLFSST